MYIVYDIVVLLPVLHKTPVLLLHCLGRGGGGEGEGGEYYM